MIPKDIDDYFVSKINGLIPILQQNNIGIIVNLNDLSKKYIQANPKNKEKKRTIEEKIIEEKKIIEEIKHEIIKKLRRMLDSKIYYYDKFEVPTEIITALIMKIKGLKYLENKDKTDINDKIKELIKLAEEIIIYIYINYKNWKEIKEESEL